MFSKNAVGKSLLKFVVPVAILNLVSCGGSGSSSIVTPHVTTFYTITAEAGSNGSVTPSGETSVAQGASQSYSIAPDSGFAVASLEVDGATVARSTIHTFTNVRANHTIRATFRAAQPDDIALSLVPARTSGVAPLAVFFDASGTTDIGITARPFHDLEYTWDFNDPTAGKWAYGAQPNVNSRNSATGPVAAHVFEKAGTYTVTLSVFDGSNTVNTTQIITVEDPEVVFAGAKTACVSTSGTFAECPLGAARITTSDFATALGNISSTVKRILFRSGEAWTQSTGYTVSQTGPGYIGSFGTGAKPHIQASGSAFSVVRFLADDWRILDLSIDALGGSGINAIQNNGRTQITVLRLDVTNTGGSFDTDNGSSGGGVNADQFAVQDSTSVGLYVGPGMVNSWIGAQRFAFQGNHMDNQGGGEHVLRFFKVIKGVVAHNDAMNPAKDKHDLKMHSANPMAAPYKQVLWDGTYTEQVVLADNYFPGKAAVTSYVVAIETQLITDDERLRDIIVERNWISGPASTLLFIDDTVGCTVRNNLFTMGASDTYGIGVAGDVGMPSPPDDLTNIYNNTFYGTHVHDSNDVHAVVIGATPLRTTVRNNLLSAPNDPGATITWMTGATLVSDHNLINNTPSALWVSGTPTVPADFVLNATSPAIGAGVAIPVWDDFIRTSRAATWDVGAYQH